MEENTYTGISLIRVFMLMTHIGKILNVNLAFKITIWQVDFNNLREQFSLKLIISTFQMVILKVKFTYVYKERKRQMKKKKNKIYISL